MGEMADYYSAADFTDPDLDDPEADDANRDSTMRALDALARMADLVTRQRNADGKKPKQRGQWKRGWCVDGVFYEEHVVVCPTCSRPMPMQPGIHGRPYYTCPLDDMTIGCHPDGRPLGTPANAETRTLRKEAHLLFDRVWRKGDGSRKKGYEWMAEVMKVPEAEAHIARFDKEQCEQLIEVTKAILAHTTPRAAHGA